MLGQNGLNSVHVIENRWGCNQWAWWEMEFKMQPLVVSQETDRDTKSGISGGITTLPSPSRILRSLNLSQTPQFSQELASFPKCGKFSTVFDLRLIPWRHPTSHSVEERLFLSFKYGMSSIAFSSWQELHRTNKPKVERIHATRLGYAAQTIYLLGPELRAALDHATPLYTVLGDAVKKVVEFTAESITSQSNLVRSFQIQRSNLLKLRISEQTPLLWKAGKTLFNKQISTIHHGFNITTGTTCGRNGLNVFYCF